MKVNLGCGQDVRLGYLNIDLNPFNPEVKKDDFKTLKNSNIENGSVEEIIASNILGFISIHEVPAVISLWKEKMKAGGTLYISNVDYSVLGHAMALEQISTEDLNKMLFTEKGLTALYNLTSMDTLLRHLGFSVESKGYLENSFYIKVSK